MPVVHVHIAHNSGEMTGVQARNGNLTCNMPIMHVQYGYMYRQDAHIAPASKLPAGDYYNIQLKILPGTECH